MADNILYRGKLVVTADTLQAENALKSLQGSLNNLLSNPSSKNNLNNNFKETLQTVTTLKAALNGAVNTDTGKLNLTKFNQSLIASKTSFSELSSKLKGMGAEGQNAFLQLARSISTAEVPLKKTNTLLQNFATTLKNTVKWQISSSIVHGFMGAIQTATGYAKDLNSSLNNIRIVTGNSAEEMAKFAKEANKAAKSLGTTTTSYSNASLIYYQQGLSDEEVKKRTDVTVKMANVTKESAQDVSNYMTAIWNNFDDGSKSLEYYADVMTALGAATASSTDEIAAGLEKFAAVADTIGLSYEYATAALATVTAETRQSADVVGNSFKTLFSRIQGLNLGETLDDGTTMNKYSNALNKVGISIKDSNGDLKAMDEILNEMGSKWNTLAKDEQMALAQTVGGVRQYNQLISLMDNWSVFQDNLKTATTSSGELQKQADIYAESWEASSKRVRAAAEGIYDSLINEDFFIGVNNTLEDTLGIIERLIDSLGGMPGVLALVGVAMTKAFAPGMAKGITEGLYNLGSGNGNTEAIKQIRQQVRDELNISNIFGSEGSSERVNYEGQTKLTDANLAFEQYKVDHNISATQQAYYDANKEAYEKVHNERVQNLQALEQTRFDIGNFDEEKAYLNKKYGKEAEANKAASDAYYNFVPGETLIDYFSSWDENKYKNSTNFQKQKKIAQKAKKLMEENSGDDSNIEEELKKLYEKMGKVTPEVKNLTDELDLLGKAAGETGHDISSEREEKLKKDQEEQEKKEKSSKAKEEEILKNLDLENIKNKKDSIANTGEGLSKSIQGVSELAVGITAISGAIQTLNDDTLSFGEKFTTVLMSAATSIPSVVDGLKNFNEGFKLFKGNLKDAISKIIIMRLGTAEQVAALTAETGALQGEALAQEASNLAKVKGLALLGKYLIIIGAVVAVIWALVAAYQAARANSIEGQLEKTNKALEETQTAAEEAKTALEELSGAFDNYNNTVKALDECTKGTKEYRDALREANIAALDLLQVFPELYSTGGVSTNSEGLIEISEEAQNKLIEAQEKAVGNIERSEDFLTFRKTDLEIQQQTNDYIHNKTSGPSNVTNEKFEKIKSDQEELAKYTITRTNTENGTDLLSIQTQIWEAAKLAYSSMEDNYDRGAFIDTVESILDSNYAEGVKKFINNEELLSWADELVASNLELKTAIEANTEIAKLSNEQAVKDALGEKAEGKTDAEIAVLGGQLSKREQEIYDEWYAKGTGWGISQASGRSNNKVQEIWKEYQKATGTKHELASNAVLGNDYNRSLQVLDENGKPYELSMETIASQIASAKATEELNNFDEEAILKKLQNVQLPNGSDSGEIFTDYLTNRDFSGLTAEEYEKIQDIFSNENNKDDIKKTLDEDIFGGLTDEERATLTASKGAEDWDAYLNGMIEDAQSLNISDFEKVFDNLNYTPFTFNPEKFKTYSLKIQQNVAEALNTAFISGGKDAAEALNTMLFNVAGKLSPEKMQEVLNFINNYDFKNGTIEEFQNQLSGISGGLITAGDASGLFAQKMIEVGNSIPINQLGDFVSQLEQLIVLISNLKIGDILSDDVITKLKDMGIAVEDFTVKTYEGLVLTEEIPIDELQAKAREAYTTASDAYNFIKGRDWYAGDQKFDSEGALQYALGLTSGGDAQFKTITNFTSLLGDAKYDIFRNLNGVQRSNEDIDNLLKEENTSERTAVIQQAMVQALLDFIQAGNAGEYNPENRITSEIAAAGSAENIANIEGFYDKNGDITKVGADGLEAYASLGGEDYAWALDEYNNALKEAQGKEELVAEAAKKLYENLQLIEKTKAGNNIRDLVDKLEKIDEMDFNERSKSIADLTKSVGDFFGTEVDEDFFLNEDNLKVLKEWESGVEGAEEKLIALLNADNVGSTLKENFEDWKIEPTIRLNENQLNGIQSAIDTFLNGGIDPITMEVVGKGDFTQLLTQLTSLGVPAQNIANLIASIGGVSLEPEGIQELADLLSKFIELTNKMKDGSATEDDAKALASLADQIGAFGFEGFVPSQGNPSLTTVSPTSGGGGGGGGGGSSSREDLMDELSQKQMDVYDKQIQKSEAQRAGLDPEKQSEFIQNEIDLLEEEQKILEKQIGTYKKLMKEKVDAFNEKYAAQGFEIKLTDDGMIANLSELYAQLQTELQEANSDSEARNIEKMMRDLEEATSLQDRIDDNVAAIADKERQQAEKALEDITQRIDWRIKKIDYQIDRLNYYQEKLLTQAHGNKQTIEAMLEGFQYQEQEMLQLFQKGDTLRQGINELSAAKAQYPDYEHMFNEKILEYQSDLIDVNTDILELRKEMEDLVQEVLDLALEEIDTQTDRIDKYVTMLDHFQSIIDLSGRTMLDQALKVQIGTTKVETMVNKMSILKQQMEGLSDAVNSAQAALDARIADGDETSVSFWENQVEMLKHELETATEEFLGSWEEALDSAAELFEMRVELAISNLSDALSPFSSLEIFQQNYDNQKTIMDQYLDDATRLYELNKLNRQLNKNIADENDLLAKSKLRDIQQQIFDLQKAGVKMSQFDLDILQKRYDLQLAEIALLEAQNSKTSMRLVRDAAGNWNYVYDADEEKIEDATQKYEDALYQLDKAAKDYVDDVSKQLIDMQVEYSEALGDLDKNSADYQNQVLALQEHYLQRQRYLLDELNKGVEKSGMTFHDTLYGQMTDIYSYEDAYNQFLNSSNQIVSDLITNYKDWQSVVETAMGAAGTSWENFGINTEGTLDSLETHIQSLCDEISKLVDVLMGYVNTSINMVEQWQTVYSKQVDTNLAMNEAIINNSSLHGSTSFGEKNFSSRGNFSSGSLGSINSGWTGGPSTAKGRTLGAWDSLNSEYLNPRTGRCSAWVTDVYGTATGQSIQAGTANEFIINFADKYTKDLSELPDGSIVGFYMNNGYGHEMIKVGNQLYGTNSSNGLEKISFEEAQRMYGSNNIHAYIDENQENLDKVSDATKMAYEIIENNLDVKGAQKKIITEKDLTFKTGGYTGNFGPDTRLAYVHEKELILNQNDTRNILNAVKENKTSNYISSKIDEKVSNMLSSTNSSLSNLIRQIQIPVYDTMPIEQKVEIMAEFPGVTNHNEIEEALTNLSINASQYLNLNKGI